MDNLLNQPHQTRPKIVIKMEATCTSKSYHQKSINTTMTLIFGVVIWY